MAAFSFKSNWDCWSRTYQSWMRLSFNKQFSMRRTKLKSHQKRRRKLGKMMATHPNLSTTNSKILLKMDRLKIRSYVMKIIKLIKIYKARKILRIITLEMTSIKWVSMKLNKAKRECQPNKMIWINKVMITALLFRARELTNLTQNKISFHQ